MEITIEMLIPGFVCRFSNTEYIQIRENPTLISGTKVEIETSGRRNGRWLMNAWSEVDIKQLTPLTPRDRSVLLLNGWDAPLPPVDPILLSMINEKRLQDVIRTLARIKTTTELYTSILSDTEKEDLFKMMRDIEANMISNPTVFQLVCEIYFAIGSKASLRRLVGFRDEGRSLGASMDTLAQQALETLFESGGM